MFSIVIPSWNNIQMLQCCINSILQNSKATHQIIVHVNEGADGTIKWLREQNIEYTFSITNVGVCKAVNLAATKAKHAYIMYMNDDMYCTPKWDQALMDTIMEINTTNFMLSATLIEPTNTSNPCIILKDFGRDIITFKEKELIAFANNYTKQNWSGAFWPPNIVPKILWDTVGGFSESFSPGMSSDDDFVAKLWQQGCRTFIGVGSSKVYHFQGKSTKRIVKNNGRLQFLQKWGITQGDFRKHYLKIGQPVQILYEPNILIKSIIKTKGFLKRIL